MSLTGKRPKTADKPSLEERKNQECSQELGGLGWVVNRGEIVECVASAERDLAKDEFNKGYSTVN